MTWWNKTNHKQTSSLTTPVAGGGNSQNLNQRFSLTSPTRKGHLQERPQNNRHSLHLASPARGGDLHRKSVGFKALAIICLALAIISTVGLSIGRTYSRESTVSSATDQVGDAQVLASNTCDPTNINAQTCASIGVLSSTTPDGVSGGATTTIDIPKSGGIAVGRHTITVQSNDISGYTVTVEGSASINNEVDLVDKDKFDSSNPDKYRISSVTNDYFNNGPASLPANTWGIAYPDNPGTNRFSAEEDYRRGLPSSITGANGAVNGGVDNPDNQSVLANAGWVTIPTKGNSQPGSSTGLGVVYAGGYSGKTDTFDVYYGVNVPDPQLMLAGNYTADVVYTVTTNNATPVPTLDKFVINDTVQAGQTGKFAIMGQNLDTAYEVKLCRASTNECSYATNINTYPGTDKQGTIVSFTSPSLTTVDSYDVYVTTQGGTRRIPSGFRVQEESICRNGDPNSDCQVDRDNHLFPVVYDEELDSWTLVSPNSLQNDPGSWYDYANKQWANAITIMRESSYNKYDVGWICASSSRGAVYSKGGMTGGMSCQEMGYETTWSIMDGLDMIYAGRYSVTENDLAVISQHLKDIILGYWVYIPRYAYEVQRPNAIDRVVTDEYPLPDNKITNNYNSHSIRNEFSIHFEKATDTKKTPAETCNTLNITKPNQMWVNGTPTREAGPDNTNILAKDYRTGCAAPGNANNISRLYTDANTTANNTTWATHPAFTFGSTELNGLWIGKFETTGTRGNPTILPNQHVNTTEYIGDYFTMAKSIGQYSDSIIGGNNISTTKNGHGLSTTSSHLAKNSEWGAITYLAGSNYGAGVNNIMPNTAMAPSKSTDADGDSGTYGVTGCGPYSPSDTKTYTGGATLNSTNISSENACSADGKHSYNQAYGMLSSTTGNVTGVYDMVGGAWDVVAGNGSNSSYQSTSSSSVSMRIEVQVPYVDLYPTFAKPVWSVSSNDFQYQLDGCDSYVCLGGAMHEVMKYQSISDNTSAYGGISQYPENTKWQLRGGTSVQAAKTIFFPTSQTSWMGDKGSDRGYRITLVDVN